MRLTEEDISGLDVGDIFYECDYGHNLELELYPSLFETKVLTFGLGAAK